jgi:hypothetical protein
MTIVVYDSAGARTISTFACDITYSDSPTASRAWSSL